MRRLERDDTELNIPGECGRFRCRRNLPHQEMVSAAVVPGSFCILLS